MQRNQQDFRTEKYLRYGIRKYSFGAASVAIAAGLMFLGNGAVSATEVQGAEVSSVTTANLGNQADSKDKSVKAEADKVEEAKKVKKEILEASISTLESKLSTAKYAEAFVLSSAKEALATAKATLANAEASQAEVDQQAATVSALSLVVTESNTAGFDKKQAVDQEAAKAEAEKTATPVEKALSVATTTLTQVSSEAEATNKLAETQLAKADVKEENKAAVTAAVAKNQAVLAETKTLLADKSVTKEQVDAQLERLNESILAVYNELKKAGIGRDGKFEAVLPSTTGTTTGKVDTVKNDTIERYKNFKNYKYGASFLGVENKQQYTADKNNGIMWYDFGKAYKSGGKFTAISNDLGKPTTDISIYETTNENLKRDAQAAGVTKAAGYQLALQVGTVFEQELYPGYVVRMEVTELKPYETTDVYKERAQKAGVEVKHTKDNSEITKNSIRYDGREVDVVIQKEKEGNPKNAGIVTGNMFNRFGPARDNATVGVTWKLTRFLNGKELKGADVLLADGEQLTNTETVNYVTDGGNWELVEEANAQQNQQGDPLTGSTPSVSLDGNGGYKWPDGSYAEGYAAPLRRWSLTSADDLKQETHLVGGARNSKHEGGAEDYRDFFNRKNNNYYKAYLDLDENGEPKLGLGTQVMSPYHTFNVNSHYNTNSAELGYASRNSWNASKTIPIFGSRDAQHVSVYINAAGMQNAMIGFLAEDRGDAPLTYGEARHSINSVNQRTGDRIQQPYLGSALPDFERKTEVTQENGKYVSKPIETTPWTGDDDINVTNNPGTKDEGEEQLVGVGKKYSVVTLSDGTTTISFKASNGSGEFDKADGTGTKQTLSGKAYVRGWIDFNENGRFDPEEESDVVEVNGNNQDVTLRFSNKARTEAALNGKVSELGTRIRIAMSKNEILVPTGSAATGEVEDFKTLTTTAPKGSVKQTSGVQGEKQSAVLTFTAFGTQNTDHSAANTIDTTKLPVIVSADGVEHGQSYTVAGQGTYTVDNDGLVTFTPEATFVGTADGIFVRRVDKNGNSTGWTSTILQDKDTAVTDTKGRSTYTNFDGRLDVTKAVEKTVTLNGTATTSMDAVYIPTVTPKELEGKNVDSTDIQGKPQKKTPTFNLADTTTAVTPSDKYPAKLVDASGNKVETLKVDGQGTYTINPTTGEVTFTPEPNFKGTAKPVTIELETAVGSDKNGTPVLKKATATYTPTVVGATPTAQPATSTGIQGDTQTGTVAFTAGKATVEGVEKEVPLKANSAKLLNADGSVPTEATVPAYAADGVTKVGTYSIDPSNNTVTFTPTDKTYKGTVQPANVQAEDENGTTVKTTYTPHIVGVAPTATPAESTNIQGEVQSGVVTFAPGKATIDNVEKSVAIKEGSVKLVNADGSVPTEATVPAYAADGVTKVGTYSIDPSNNTVTFTPTDKTYKGTVLPANVQAEDENGTTVKTTYTPHIVGVVPTAEPATSTDIQGVEQSKEVTFTPGKTEINGTEKTVAIDTTSFKLLDENENAVDSVPAKNPAGDVIGTYTLKVVDGKVNAVFTPTDKTYAGEVEPVTIQAKDTNGTVVKTTYTPSITPVEPSGTPTTSEGIQGAKQEGTPSFTPGDERIPMKIDADQPAKLVNPETGKPTDDTTIPAKDNDGNTVGTYTIEPTTGKVTFTPNKDFTGTPVAATVQAKDANGTPTTATYEPTVKPVTPTGSDTVTEDVQGSIQKGKPTFEGGTVTVNGEEKTVAIDEDKPAKLVDPKTGDPVESVTIDGEGTYTVTPDGTVTFTPEKNFTGKGTGVTVQREDKNATPVTAKYTPVVKPATPTSSDVITTNVQGAIQEGTPTFTGGKVTINGQEKTVAIDEAVKPKFDDGTTEKVVPNEGTYTIDENGKVTFTPEKTFTGQAAGVTVKRVDKNGTPVTAKYTPVVIPVSPTSKDAESEGPKGQSQEGTPTFTGGKVTLNGKEVPVAIDENVKPKFDDGTTEKVVPNEGTYTIDENGKVTFTPEPNFVGKATGVTVKRVDKNGTPVTAKYTPTVRPDTRFVVIEKDGKETDLLPSKDGAKPSEPIPGYNVVRTEIDEKGNTKHIYEKVKTSFKDKEGNEIPKYPSEPGTVDKKDIPEYRFVETKKLPNGDTEHIYEKVKTSFKDKEGNEIPKYPSEPGTVDKKDIPEYRFVETKKLPNGDTEHIYEKVKTSFKDKEGNEIPKYPSEPGTVDKKDIPEYRFVETKKLPNGDTEHIYEKVKTSFKDKEGNVIPNYPTEDGEQPKKDIPGYRFVETKKLPNGDTEHIYEKVKTSFKDKEGNEIPKYPSEPGTVDKKDIPEYRFVETKKLPNGDTEHIYEKVKTSFKDKEGNEIPKYPSEPGTVDKKDIPEYRFVETKKLPNGDTEHIYEKVKTSFKDKEGNEIPKYPSEPGTVDKKDIPEYRFVETKKLPNGDTEHVYEKVKTSHKDKEGNVIPNYPTEDGEQPKKDIPGYRFVETKKLPNGDTEHVYEKVKTSHKDKEGNEIPNYPTEDGEQPKKDIPGYRFVETKKLPNGDTEHIYEKVKTSFKDKEGNEIPKYPSEPGTVDKKDIPEYRFVETKKLPNGDTEHIYEKVKTSFKDKEGNEIPKYPSEPGTVDKKDIPEYRFVETKKLPNGDTEHVYEKVKTSHKDKEGNVIPNYPTEDGEQPKKDIPGYRFVETKKLPNGDTEHVYEKVKTSHKDKEGNVIPKYPSEPGTVDKKDIPEYRFVETKKLPNGDTEHIYEKVKTSFKDKEGKEIPNYPTEDGDQPKKDILGYRFVETKKLPNGDTEHVYEKVTTFFKDKDGNEISEKVTGSVDKKDIPGYRFVETKKLPNGDIEHVYEKVSTPSPAPQPHPGKQNTTTWTDENGNPLKPTEPGSKEPGTISGYEYVKTVTDQNGNIRHIFRKVQTPSPVEPTQPAQPVEPATPAMPEQSAKPQVQATPAQQVQPTAAKEAEGKRELPNTGTESNASLAALGLLGALSGFGLLARKKKED